MKCVFGKVERWFHLKKISIFLSQDNKQTRSNVSVVGWQVDLFQGEEYRVSPTNQTHQQWGLNQEKGWEKPIQVKYSEQWNAPEAFSGEIFPPGVCFQRFELHQVIFLEGSENRIYISELGWHVWEKCWNFWKLSVESRLDQHKFIVITCHICIDDILWIFDSCVEESHLDEQPVSWLFSFALLSKPNVVCHLNPK